MSEFCCITDLIQFMMKEADKLMSGSMHEDDLFVVHDALVLMTEKEMITYMKDNNYFHCWLLPTNGSQDGTPYDGRPVGNFPKFMPLYNILNRYILHSFCLHCVLIYFVLDGEGTEEEEMNICPSFSTPKDSSEDSSVYGNRKWEHLLQQGLSRMLIWHWNHWELSTTQMRLKLRGLLIEMDKDGKW